jgi:hypothetical protein
VFSVFYRLERRDNESIRQFSFMRVPLGFLKCANGPHLPLTVRKSSASMSIRRGKIFSYYCGETNSSNAWDHYASFVG